MSKLLRLHHYKVPNQKSVELVGGEKGNNQLFFEIKKQCSGVTIMNVQ